MFKLLSVSPVGSQRISDSEFSDYDCEEGVGVVSGKISVTEPIKRMNASFLQYKVILCY